MIQFNRLAVFLSLLFLSSCFASRETAQEPKTIIVNPIKTSVDTTTLLSNDTLPDNKQDTVVKKAADTTLICPDSLKHDTLTDVTKEKHIELCDTVPRTDSLPSTDSLFTDLADTIVIVGTGDIMPGTNYPDSRYLPPGNNCTALFDPVRDVLQDGDVTFGNLEGVFCAEGGTPKKCNNPQYCYVFRMPDSYLDCILDAGYDLLSVANNHVNDFGPEGRRKTAELLTASGVTFAGFNSHPYAILEKDSIKYGFAAFAPHIGTVSLKDYENAASIVSNLDTLCDIVIVSFHGGAEGKDYQHVPCTDEEYLGYNRGNVCKFAHTVVDAGADVVFGHGPHVTRAMELYNDRLICYSLGNFCTYARFNLRGPNGIAPIVRISTSKKGEFIEGKVISVLQTGEGGPFIDHNHGAALKLKELTILDFPETNLEIDERGKITKKEVQE